MRASGLIAYAAGACTSAEIGVAIFFLHFFLRNGANSCKWRNDLRRITPGAPSLGRLHEGDRLSFPFSPKQATTRPPAGGLFISESTRRQTIAGLSRPLSLIFR